MEIDHDSRDGKAGKHIYTHTYLILMCNYLELAHKRIVPIEDNQAMDNSMTSDDEISMNQAEGLGGEALYQNPHLTFYITGKLELAERRVNRS